MSPEHFRERSDAELEELSDEAAIAYIREAHDAGRNDAGGRALAVLVYGHWDRVRARVARKTPAEEVDEVTSAVIESALGASFQGSSVGELHAFINRIAERRVADHHRGRRCELVSLPDPGDDAPWGPEPSEDSEEGSVLLGMVVEQLLEALAPDHRRVVELYCLECRAAAEVAARVESMTEANVHQIGSRFRARLREALRGSDTEGEQ